MRGINDTTKREEVVDVFKEGKFELLALTETKLKEERERYHGVELMTSLALFQKWKELGKSAHPVEQCVAQCSGRPRVC